MSDNLRGIILMNIAMLAFVINDSFMKAVTQDLPLFQAIFLRGALTSAALFALGFAMHGKLRLTPPRADRMPLALRNIGEVLATLFFLGALMFMPLANLSAIMQSLPLAVTLAAALFLGERVKWQGILAIAIGFIGVVLIIRPGPEGFDIWALAGLASVAAVVLRDLSTRKVSSELPSVTVAIWASTLVTLMGAVGCLVQPLVALTWLNAAQILGATVSLVVGYMTVVMVMRVGDIAVIAPFRYTALLWALLIGYWFFGDFPDRVTLLGAGLIVASGIYTLLLASPKKKAAAE